MLKQLKVFLLGLIIGGILVGSVTFAAPVQKTITALYDNIKIYVDGELIVPKDATGKVVEPFIVDGTTFLPVRAVSSALGKNVQWDEETSSVYIGEYSKDIVEVTVSTADEFVAALGSNKRILLAPGIYNLSELEQEYNVNSRVHWTKVYDGNELYLSEIVNLTIEGTGKQPSEIVVKPRYAFVLNFFDSSNINIINIKAGHTEGGYCTGGVFAFNDCENIIIDKTEMYGCGTEGLMLSTVSDMKITDSSIYECTYDIMTARYCKNIAFDRCLFRDNGEFPLVNIYQTSDFIIDNSEFRDNIVSYGDTVFYSSLSQNIVVKNTKFINNTAKYLSDSSTVIFENNTFDGNEFDNESE